MCIVSPIPPSSPPPPMLKENCWGLMGSLEWNFYGPYVLPAPAVSFKAVTTAWSDLIFSSFTNRRSIVSFIPALSDTQYQMRSKCTVQNQWTFMSLLQVAQHYITGIQTLTKALGWHILALNSHIGVGDLEPVGNAVGTIIASPFHDKFVVLSFDCHNTVSFAVYYAVLLVCHSFLHVSQLVPLNVIYSCFRSFARSLPYDFYLSHHLIVCCVM